MVPCPTEAVVAKYKLGAKLDLFNYKETIADMCSLWRTNFSNKEDSDCKESAKQ